METSSDGCNGTLSLESFAHFEYLQRQQHASNVILMVINSIRYHVMFLNLIYLTACLADKPAASSKRCLTIMHDSTLIKHLQTGLSVNLFYNWQHL